MEQAVHIAMMEPYNISADWNMGSPTSERLPTRPGKVFGEELQRFWVTQHIPCYVFEDIKIRLGWIGVSLGKKPSPSRMEAVREIQSFAEHQALVLLGTIWMRHPSLCLSGAKLRLKKHPWNRCTPDNHCNYRQHAATGFENHCFSEKALLFCSSKHRTNDLKIWWNKYL